MRSHGILSLAAALALAVFAPMSSSAEAPPQAQWLRHMPQGLDLGIAIPDVAQFEKQLAELSLHPALTGGWSFAAFREEALAQLAKDEAPESFAAYLQQAGIAPEQGAGFYYDLSAKEYAAVLSLASQETALAHLQDLGAEEAVDTALADTSAAFIPDANLGYFFHGDHLFVASTLDMLQQLAEGVASQRAFQLSQENAPPVDAESLLLLIDFKALAADEVATEESVAAVEGLLNAWRSAVDEAVVAIKFDPEFTQFRFLTHARPYAPPPGQTPAAAEASAKARAEAEAQAAAALGPMTMAPYIPNDAIAAVNLRLTKGLKTLIEQILRGVITDEAQAAQVVGGVNLAYNMLGSEIAAALTDYTGTPEFLVVAPIPNTQQLKNFLPMANIEEPVATEGGVDIFGVPDIPAEGATLYLALTETLVVAGTRLDAVKSIVAAGAQPPAGSGYGEAVPEALREQANNGYLILQGDRLAQMLNQVAPSIVQDPDVVLGDLSLAMQQSGEWHEITMVVPDLAPLSEAVGASVAEEKEESAVNESRAHLKALIDAAQAYAADHDGTYPPPSPVPGRLMMAQEAVFPEYLADLWMLVNPGAEDAVAVEERLRETQALDDHHYFYLSHAVWDEASGIAFTEEYRRRFEEALRLAEDWEREEGGPLLRLDRNVVDDLNAALAAKASAETDGEGTDAATATAETAEDAEAEAQAGAEEGPAAPQIAPAQIPVFIERPSNWEHGRIHVVYLDGHVQPVLPGTFPNTDAFLNALLSIEAMEPAEEALPAAADEPAEDAVEAEGGETAEADADETAEAEAPASEEADEADADEAADEASDQE